MQEQLDVSKNKHSIKDDNLEEVPELRFPEFKELWQKNNLENIAYINKGFTPSTSKKEYWENGEFNWLSIADMGNKYLNYSKKKITQKGTKNKLPIPPNTLVMSFKLSIGKLGILNKPMYTNEAIVNFNWKTNEFDTEFMYYYLSSINILKYGSQAAKGITLNNEILNSIPIIHPSIQEQKKIGNFLSLIDKKLILMQKKHKNIENYINYMLNITFSRKSRIDDSEWKEMELGTLGKFYRGHSYNNNNVVDKGLTVLRSNNIQNNQLIFNKKELQYVNKDCKEEIKLLKDDIVICMSNGTKKLVGKSAVFNGNYDNEVTVGAFCSIFRTSNPLCKYLLRTDDYKRNLYLILAGSNINNLKNSDIEKFKFYIPKNLNEEEKINNFFSLLDNNLNNINKELNYLQKFKKGLLQKMFV